MGKSAIVEIIKRIKTVLERCQQPWKAGSTIMIDVFMRRERHLYVEPLPKKKGMISLRDFGPRSEDDLLDQKSLSALEKLLPVLNGLIYNKKGKPVLVYILYREPRSHP